MIWLPLSEQRRRVLEDEEVIIIMGRGHSGTRVMTRICENLGINVGATSELKSGDTADLRFTRSIKKIAIHDINANQKGMTKPWLVNRFQRSVDRYLRDLKPTGMWGWKFPETYLIGPYVRETFPRARYIHLLRDGRDLAFKNHLTDDPNRKLGRVLLEHIGMMGQPHYLQAAASWEFQLNGWETFAETLPKGSVIDFRFEDLLSEPSECVESLAAFLGVPVTDQCKDFVARELDTSKRRQHRENDPSEVSKVVAKIGDTLRRYDYVS
ncbi:MAG: sulfotransferase [Verrucomicrobiota bacterium]